MRHSVRLIPIAMVAVLLAGCFSSNASSEPSTVASVAASAGASANASDDPPCCAPSVEPEPSEDLGPFSCDLPIHVDATIARAQIIDVRAGTHDGYDRVVFEFAGGFPEATLGRAEPPFFQDASGFPIEVQGSSFLGLVMRGGTKQTEQNTSSYDGPLEFETDFPGLVHLIEGGDFEAQSTWYFGLNAESCVRVLTLEDDGVARLVIDIEQ